VLYIVQIARISIKKLAENKGLLTIYANS
jgi:hypothetical protein